MENRLPGWKSKNLPWAGKGNTYKISSTIHARVIIFFNLLYYSMDVVVLSSLSMGQEL